VIDAAAVRAVVAEVLDPEVPVLTIDDLGILRDVRVDAGGHVDVDITPTYSGCPAMEVIRGDVERALRDHGIDDATVRMVLSPAWTTDWMSDEGRRKLHEYGIAPPAPVGALRTIAVACPQCGSAHTGEISRFGSTPCKALRRCGACREPFDHFKPH
jgi:ring-1,2-phenylacetyl-CoA epoxidase subunit PaaD